MPISPLCGQVYVEVWEPGDFGMAWDSNEAQGVASKLSHDFDATIGTNWDRIEDAGGEPPGDNDDNDENDGQEIT